MHFNITNQSSALLKTKYKKWRQFLFFLFFYLSSYTFFIILLDFQNFLYVSKQLVTKVACLPNKHHFQREHTKKLFVFIYLPLFFIKQRSFFFHYFSAKQRMVMNNVRARTMTTLSYIYNNFPEWQPILKNDEVEGKSTLNGRVFISV